MSTRPTSARLYVLVVGGLAVLGAGLGRAAWWPWVALDDDAAFSAAVAGARSDRAVIEALLADARRADRPGADRAESVIFALALSFVEPEALARVKPLAEALVEDARVPPPERERLAHLLAVACAPGVDALGPDGPAGDAVDAIVGDASLSDEDRVERLVALAVAEPSVRAWALLRAAWIEHGRRGLYLHAASRYQDALAASDGDARIAEAAQAGLDALDALRTWRAAKLAAVTPAGEAPKLRSEGAPLDEGEDAQADEAVDDVASP